MQPPTPSLDGRPAVSARQPGHAILLVARHFPPHVSGAARRLAGLTAALKARGHTVYVVAPELPPGVDGLAVWHPAPTPDNAGAPEPSQILGSLKQFLRSWLLWPDPDIRWSLRVADHLKKVKDLHFDWVITSSPPESVHLIGRQLARRYRAGWAADFRDLWFARPLRAELDRPFRSAVERRIARRIVRQADVMFAVDQFILEELKGLGAGDRASVLPHGSDPFKGPSASLGPGVHVVHTGSFSLSDRSRHVGTLLDAFARAHERSKVLRLHLVGRLSHEEQEAVARSSAAAAINVHGVVSHPEALAFQAAADALVLVAAPDSEVPPGKWVEYKSAGKPVVILGGPRWQADILPNQGMPEDAFVKLARGDVADLVPRAVEVASQDQIAGLLEQALRSARRP